MISFGEFKAFIFLGESFSKNYKDDIFGKRDELLDSEQKVNFFNEDIKQKIDSEFSRQFYEFMLNNKSVSAFERNHKIETDKISGFIDFIDWGSEENKAMKKAKAIYVVTQSKKTKDAALLKWLWISKLIKYSGIEVESCIEVLVSRKGAKANHVNFSFNDRGTYTSGVDVSEMHASYNLTMFVKTLTVHFEAHKDKLAYATKKSISKFEIGSKNLIENFDYIIECIEKGVNLPRLSQIDYEGEQSTWVDSLIYDKYYKLQNSEERFDFSKNTYDFTNLEAIDCVKIEKKKVLFDFETLMIPFSMFDGIEPKIAVPVQYSVIYLDEQNNIIDQPINEIFDFSSQSTDDFYSFFKNMINNIHRSDSVYVVHSKSYENSCIRSMMNYFASINKIDNETVKKCEAILSPENSFDTKTVVLKNFVFDAFNDRGRSQRDKKSSLKYVVKWMNHHRTELLEKHEVKNYDSDLQVHNGLDASDSLCKLFYSMLGKSEIQPTLDSLKKYCENDVRAMISLIEFIKENNSK